MYSRTNLDICAAVDLIWSNLIFAGFWYFHYSTLHWRCCPVLKVWCLLKNDSLGLSTAVQQLVKGWHTAAAVQDEKHVGATDIFLTDSSLFSLWSWIHAYTCICGHIYARQSTDSSNTWYGDKQVRDVWHPPPPPTTTTPKKLLCLGDNIFSSEQGDY